MIKCYECKKELEDIDREATDYDAEDLLCEECSRFITATGGGCLILPRKR